MEREVVQVSQRSSRTSVRLSLFVRVLAVSMTLSGAVLLGTWAPGEDAPGQFASPDTQADGGPVASVMTVQPGTEAALETAPASPLAALPPSLSDTTVMARLAGGILR